MTGKNKFATIIVSGGSGERMNSSIPKQYLPLNNKMVVEHTIEAFANHPEIGKIFLVVAKDAERFVKDIPNIHIVYGGKTRQESVRNGLREAVKNGDIENILIHDAVRPFVSKNIIDNVITSLKEGNKAVIPAIKISDTIKESDGNNIIRTLDREKLYSVQTPQGFKLDSIIELHEKFKKESFSDDSLLFENANMEVKITEGSKNNFKITTEEDMAQAEKMFPQSLENRIGQGYDVHAFEEGDGIILCGIKIPYHRKLKGHSDADVAWHALTDAILGAIGEGDIGEHFSDKDDRWRGHDSIEFLKHAYALAKEKGFVIINADITIICEEPKLFEHKKDMRKSTSLALGIDEQRINIKATTTEKMGFLGRKEGIAAQAIANLAYK